MLLPISGSGKRAAKEEPKKTEKPVRCLTPGRRRLDSLDGRCGSIRCRGRRRSNEPIGLRGGGPAHHAAARRRLQS